MRITRKLATAGLAGVLAVSGVAVLTAPVASAVTSTEDGGSSLGSRLEAVREALAGLVTDGTLSQAQADEVATTLDESDALRGPGGHGRHGGHGGGFGRGLDLDVAAEALGLTADELRTALAVDGTTLADVAAAAAVDLSVLVDALVDAGTERLQGAVEDGRLTQAEADERIAALPEVVAEKVEDERRGRGGPGHGPRGGGRGAPDDGTTDGGTHGTTDASTDGTTDAGAAAQSSTTA